MKYYFIHLGINRNNIWPIRHGLKRAISKDQGMRINKIKGANHTIIIRNTIRNMLEILRQQIQDTRGIQIMSN